MAMLALVVCWFGMPLMEKVKSHYDAAQNESTFLTKQDFKNDPARAVATAPPIWREGRVGEPNDD